MSNLLIHKLGLASPGKTQSHRAACWKVVGAALNPRKDTTYLSSASCVSYMSVNRHIDYFMITSFFLSLRLLFSLWALTRITFKRSVPAMRLFLACTSNPFWSLLLPNSKAASRILSICYSSTTLSQCQFVS